jgi:hypothetical protein
LLSGRFVGCREGTSGREVLVVGRFVGRYLSGGTCLEVLIVGRYWLSEVLVVGRYLSGGTCPKVSGGTCCRKVCWEVLVVGRYLLSVGTCREVLVGRHLSGGTCREVLVGRYLYGGTCCR